MCGIAGIARREARGVSPETLARMAAAIRHRGPDGYGFLADKQVGLAHVRLSILDLACGEQPLANEDGNLWITYNGEIFNWRELRDDLESRGHHFRTHTDTEVIVHAWEEWGPRALDRFNGQFAFAIYDRRDQSVALVRDRFGVRPLFYSVANGDLVFGSEVKALFASGEVDAAPDPNGFDEVLAFWGPRAPQTVFRDIRQMEPGSYALWSKGTLTAHKWWRPDLTARSEEPRDAVEQLDHLLRSAVDLRMRADVPVGAYLSGGLDSSITCTLAATQTPHALRTFSVTFADPQFDESAHQLGIARAIASDHAVSRVAQDEIARVFPEVVRHAETPLMRAAPAPMYLLAQLARARGISVVLTGEGADELFLGYDLFKETEVRRFCLRRPQSAARPRLFDRLYPYMRTASAGGEMWRRFFLEAGSPGDPLFSHQPRFAHAEFVRGFYGERFRDAARRDPLEHLRASLPAEFGSWSSLAKADYLEITTLLEGYLLSSQGDRMAMAHGVEGRYPFLDYRLFTFAASLPARSKLIGLHEKEILRRWAARVLPDSVRSRPKQPYRTSDLSAFFHDGAPRADYISDVLDARAVTSAGMFDAGAVQGLLRRCRDGRATSVREIQALVAILSSQILHHQFFQPFTHPDPLPLDRANVLTGEMISDRATLAHGAL